MTGATAADADQDAEGLRVKYIVDTSGLLTLKWRNGHVDDWVADRAESGTALSDASLSFGTARFYALGPDFFSVIWAVDGQVFELEAERVAEARLRELIGTLELESFDQWAESIPESVVLTSEQELALSEIIGQGGVPIAPSADLVVNGAVARNPVSFRRDVVIATFCWSTELLHRSDSNDIERARDALATFDSWPLVVEVRSTYEVLIADLSAAAASGEANGPVQSALCTS